MGYGGFNIRIAVVILLFIVSWLSALGQHFSNPISLNKLNTIGNEYSPTYNSWDNNIYFFRESGDNVFLSVDTSLAIVQDVKVKFNLNSHSYFAFIGEDKAIVSSISKINGKNYFNAALSIYARKQWNTPILIDNLQSESFNSHFALSPNGSKMIFVSDRHNAGETDLWETNYNGQQWSEPINIMQLNSPLNEITPCFVDENTIIYSSNGFDGMGSYDLFLAKYENGVWQRPRALVELNSNMEDSNPCFYNGKLIYSSDREGGIGGLDFYFSQLLLDKSKTNVTNIFIDSYTPSIKALSYDTISYKLPNIYYYYDTDTSSISNTKLDFTLDLYKKAKYIEIVLLTNAKDESDKANNNSKYYADLRYNNIITIMGKYGIDKSKIKAIYKFTENNENNYVLIVPKIDSIELLKNTESNLMLNPNNLHFILENINSSGKVKVRVKCNESLLYNQENSLQNGEVFVDISKIDISKDCDDINVEISSSFPYEFVGTYPVSISKSRVKISTEIILIDFEINDVDEVKYWSEYLKLLSNINYNMSISGKYANYLRLNLTNESIHIEDTNSIIHKIILEKK